MTAGLLPTLLAMAIIVVAFVYAILTAPNDLGRRRK